MALIKLATITIWRDCVDVEVFSRRPGGETWLRHTIKRLFPKEPWTAADTIAWQAIIEKDHGEIPLVVYDRRAVDQSQDCGSATKKPA